MLRGVMETVRRAARVRGLQWQRGRGGWYAWGADDLYEISPPNDGADGWPAHKGYVLDGGPHGSPARQLGVFATLNEAKTAAQLREPSA